MILSYFKIIDQPCRLHDHSECWIFHLIERDANMSNDIRSLSRTDHPSPKSRPRTRRMHGTFRRRNDAIDHAYTDKTCCNEVSARHSPPEASTQGATALWTRETEDSIAAFSYDYFGRDPYIDGSSKSRKIRQRTLVRPPSAQG